jgi:hypothetical protein
VIPREQLHASEPAPARRVRIVHLSAPVFDALIEGDLATANALRPVPLSAHFAGLDWRAVWQMRSRQLKQDPANAAWVTGVIWDDAQQMAVGRAGYHGPPDSSGVVEIGYAVDPAHRRRGYERHWNPCCSAPPANRRSARSASPSVPTTPPPTAWPPSTASHRNG